MSIPLPIFQSQPGRNRAGTLRDYPGAGAGEIYDRSGADRRARRLSRACEANDKVVQLYISTYLDVATRSRDISEYAYRRGGASLLDFLDAERSYRATQLAYRQALASYLLASNSFAKRWA